MLDRVGLVGSRLSMLEPDDRLRAYDVLTDMRVGLNLIELVTLTDKAEKKTSAVIEEALNSVAATYESRLRNRPEPTRRTSLRSIDRALRQLTSTPGGDSPSSAAALTGLRRALFPDAEPYLSQDAV
jgi:uncharacterized membrane protein YccC